MNINYNKYYSILELKETPPPTIVEIKQAYRRLSLIYHPDRNNNTYESTKKFQQINEAYTILQNQQILPQEQDHKQYHNKKHTPNIINKKDIHTELILSYEQIYYGNLIPIIIERKIYTDIETDPLIEKETVYVNVPEGIDDNEIIIIKNKGNKINNEYGDIKVTIKLKKVEIKRDGLDIYYEKTIKLKELLCGFTFEIKHPSGEKYVFNCNKDGNIILNKMIRNMGFKRENYVGNLYIKFIIEYPEYLTEEQVIKLKEIL